jgi:hypothetical protein
MERTTCTVLCALPNRALGNSCVTNVTDHYFPAFDTTCNLHVVFGGLIILNFVTKHLLTDTLLQGTCRRIEIKVKESKAIL